MAERAKAQPLIPDLDNTSGGSVRRIFLRIFPAKISGFIGNFLEHYDKAIFGLLAPFIAPLFFAEKDPLVALMWTYAVFPIACLARPLGAICFGIMADRLGRAYALFWSLLGMAIVTCGIGFLPTYGKIGGWAFFFFVLFRMLQKFCSAGETTSAAVFILEQTNSKKEIVSSLYDASSLAGCLVASSLVTWMSCYHLVEQYWRVLFWAGSLTALYGLILRLFAKESKEFVAQPKEKFDWKMVLKTYKKPLLCLILACGFGHVTYSFSFTLMNGFVPLITSITKAEVMKINTMLLVVDFAALPFFGYLAWRFGKERVMLTAALISSLSSVFLFMLLAKGSILILVGVRLVIVLCGVAFAAPYYAWALELIPAAHRCFILSIGSALGAQLIGSPACAVSLWLYKVTNIPFIPALYLMFAGFGAAFAVYKMGALGSFSRKPKLP